MEVVDGHAGGVADVECEAVAGLPDAFDAGDVFCEDEHASEGFGVAPLDLAGALDVGFWDDEAMDGSAGVDVADGEGVGIFGYFCDGDFAPLHAAKEAVRHGGHCVERMRLCRWVVGGVWG